jgi:tetratricopeptide (TPR) repeat protein
VAGGLLLLLPCARPAHAEPSAVQRAHAAWAAGRLDEALAESEAAVAEAPRDAYAWGLRGYLLSRSGRKEDALAAYDRAVAFDPLDAVSRNNRGAMLLELGRAEEARAEFDSALALDPKYADALNNRGAALERLGRDQEAASAYRAATEADPEHAKAHSNLGTLAYRQGRADEARERFRRAHDLDPTLGAPALNLLLVGGPDLERDELLSTLRATVDRLDAPRRVRARAYVALAGREAADGDFEAARALYLEALALDPDDYALLNNLAVVEDQLGLDRDAILHLEAALAERPDLLVAQNNVGIVHVHRGSLESAEAIFRYILEKDANFHRAHYNLGVVLAAEGRLAAALQSFQRAAALAPRDADIRYNLGLLRRRLGASEDEERRAYEAALILDPELAEAHLSLGCFLADPQTRRDLRDEAEARRHLTRFLELAGGFDTGGRAQANAWLAWLDRDGSR